MDFERFAHPESILRPAPFWSINDRLTPEETARQMVDMIDVGLSGGFFHSRAGLVTDYLSDEWFAAMDAALQVAKERDGYLWLYDEDRWPSGNAGGQVAGMKDEYRAATLRAELLLPGEAFAEEPDSAPRAAYVLHRASMALERVEAIAIEDIARHVDAERLVLRRRYKERIPWWSGESYANLLDPEAMQEFIKLTHEVYREHYEAEFGKRIPGMFTDEPQITSSPVEIPWYEGLPERYRAWTGRDWWADLPYLYFEGPESRKVRLFIHRTIARQFTEAFTKQMYDWCDRNHLAHTGHFMAEDTIGSQIRFTFGGVMPHYRYEHIPGVDHLCRTTDPMMLTHKQASSAARQLGRRPVLTEIFGVSRHTNTFADFKWIGDFNLVLGANFFCPHLTLYSARGRRKRDYPPNWNYQQTYWHDLRPLNDYFTRVATALNAGTAQAHILLLHSIESASAGHRIAVKSSHVMPGEDLTAANAADQTLRRALEAILNAGYECDLGDEVYLAEMGEVEGDRLRVGAMSYSVVVVPPAQTWRPSTHQLLAEFTAHGGKLIFLGEVPSELDCSPAAESWQALASRAEVVPCGRPQIQEAVERAAPCRYTLRTPDGEFASKTYVQYRADQGQEICFIVNGEKARAQEYVFTLRGGANTPLAVWDPLAGTRAVAAARRVGNDLRYRFALPPAGSLLLVSGHGATDDAQPEERLPDLCRGEVIPLPATWQFTRSEENVLVLDRLSASPDGGATWWPEDLEFRVRKRLAEHFGTAPALQWQPWVAIRKGLFDDKVGDVVLRYRFHSEVDHPQAFVVIEDLKKGQVSVNGRPVEVAGAGWQWDHDFGKVEITDLVVQGENVVDFRVRYDFLTEVEAAYIVGDFGVRLASPTAGEIIAEPAELCNGSWLEQGLPFYSGAITYRCTVEHPGPGRTFLRLLRASGILYRVRVNGEVAGEILWHPHVLELTGKLQEGENTLEIEVISSRQNTLGPLHEKNGDDNAWVGPPAFEDESNLREAFSLYDYGLLGGAELVCVIEEK